MADASQGPAHSIRETTRLSCVGREREDEAVESGGGQTDADAGSEQDEVALREAERAAGRHSQTDRRETGDRQRGRWYPQLEG